MCRSPGCCRLEGTDPGHGTDPVHPAACASTPDYNHKPPTVMATHGPINGVKISRMFSLSLVSSPITRSASHRRSSQGRQGHCLRWQGWRDQGDLLQQLQGRRQRLLWRRLPGQASSLRAGYCY